MEIQLHIVIVIESTSVMNWMLSKPSTSSPSALDPTLILPLVSPPVGKKFHFHKSTFHKTNCICVQLTLIKLASIFSTCMASQLKTPLKIFQVLGTVKPKANQVRGSRTKENFRDFLGGSFIIHQIPDGKDIVRVLSLALFDLLVVIKLLIVKIIWRLWKFFKL